jgi:diguanylate cyclase (GGDEF)-like protein
VTESTTFERGLARLIAACEAGRDVPAVLSAACDAVAAALGAATVGAYTATEDGAELSRVSGEGPDTLIAAGLEPTMSGDRALLPLVSARRSLGCIVASGVRDASGLTQARIASGVAAQAVEASRLWESGKAGAGTLDLLTSLPNHRGFQTVLGRELARAKRTGQSLAVCVVDLDGLAEFNRRHGAAEGDKVLRLAGECLSGGIRSYDCVCRLDEDEFALVLPGMTADLAATLVGRLSDTFGSWSVGDRAMTLSGGVAAFPEHAATQDDLVSLASGALRRAREFGRGRIVAWTPEVHRDAGDRDVERTMRAIEASRGHSATSRAVSEYAGHVAGTLGLEAERVDRLRLAAFLYDTTAPAGAVAERARTAARVAANTLDDEAAGWLAARSAPIGEAPLEARVLAVAEAFVTAGGHGSSAAAGRALAELWARAGGDLDAGCVGALERLVAESRD